MIVSPWRDTAARVSAQDTAALIQAMARHSARLDAPATLAALETCLAALRAIQAGGKWETKEGKARW